MISKLKKTTGFTLVELMIVMTITAIITFGLINTFNQQRIYVQYNEEMTKVLSLVKLARNYASTNRSFYNGSENLVPEGGYGIYFERSDTPGRSRIVLFANSSAATPETALQYDSADILEEEYVLAKEAILQDITLTETGPPLENVTADRMVILFSTTLAEVTLFNNGDPLNITDLPTEYDEVSIDFIRQGDESLNSIKTFTLNQISGVPQMSL